MSLNNSKKLALGVILVLFFILGTIMPVTALRENFDFFSQNKAINICSCSYTKNIHEITNTGDITSIFFVEQEGKAQPWSSLSDTMFVLEPGETKKVYDYVKVPCDSEGRYDLKTVVKTKFGIEKEIEQNVDVRSCQNIDITAQGLTVNTCPCKPAQYHFTIYNTGNHIESYSISVTPDKYTKLSATKLVIPPGESKDVVLFITKPCDVTGSYDYKLTVVAEGSNLIGEVPFTQVISQCYDYSISAPDELYVCKGFENIIPLGVTNEADVANSIKIEGEFVNEEEYDFGSLFMPPLSNQEVNLSVDPTEMDVGDYVFQINTVSERGNIEKQEEIFLNNMYCDEFGNPLPEDQQYEETSYLWLYILLGVLGLIVLLLILFFVMRGSDEDKEQKRSTLKDTSKEEDESGLSTWGIILLILLILLLLAGLGFLLYYLLYMAPSNGINQTMNGTWENGTSMDNLELEPVEIPVDEFDANATNATGMDYGSTPWWKSLWFWLPIGLLLLILLLLILWLVLRDKDDEDKKEEKHLIKKEKKEKKEKPYIKSKKRGSKKGWLWLLLLLLLLTGLVLGAYFAWPYLFGEDNNNNVLAFNTENVSMSGDNVLAPIGEETLLPVTVTNNDNTSDYTVGFNFDLPWISSADEQVTVAPGESTEAQLVLAPDNTTELGAYRLRFEIDTGAVEPMTEDFVVEVVEPDNRSWFAKWWWAIIIPLALLLLLFLIWIISRALKNKKARDEERAFIPVTQKPSKSIKKEKKVKKKEEKESSWWKWLLLLLLLLLLLGGVAFGVYYYTKAQAQADKGLNATDAINASEYEALEPVEIDPAQEWEEVPEDQIVNVGRKKTLIPLKIKNINDTVTYRITVNEDVDWISTDPEMIEVAPLGEETLNLLVDPQEGAEDGKYRIGIDVTVEDQEEKLFSSNVYVNVDKWGWLGTLLSYLIYAVLGAIILVLLILILHRKDDEPKDKKDKKDKREPKEKISLETKKDKERKKRLGKTKLGLK